MTAARVIPIAPLCFSARDNWVSFVEQAAAVKERSDASPRPWLSNGAWNPDFHPCCDCTQSHEADMVRQGRCTRGAFSWTPRAAQGSLLETA